MPKKTAKKNTKKIVKRTAKKVAKKATKKIVGTPKKITRKTKPPVVTMVSQVTPALPLEPVSPLQLAPAPPIPVVEPPVAPVRQSVPMSDMIWNEIQNVSLQLFGLPGQIVSMHCTPVSIEPSKLYVSIRSAATLPALETALSDRFTVEMLDKWVAIALKPQPLTPAKR